MGNAGLSDAVVAETDRALGDHELIKVRLPGQSREDRDQALALLAERTGSVMVTPHRPTSRCCTDDIGNCRRSPCPPEISAAGPAGRG